MTIRGDRRSSPGLCFLCKLKKWGQTSAVALPGPTYGPYPLGKDHYTIVLCLDPEHTGDRVKVW